MIEINNLTTNSVDEKLVQRTAEAVLTGENKAGFNLSIAFVGPSRMRQLNKKYLGRNRTTDVLAFPEPKLNVKAPVSLSRNLGEVVVSLRDVKKNAKRYKVSFEQELVKITIHGILHLMGYEHEKSDQEAERMLKKQEHYLILINSKSKMQNAK